MPTAPKNAKQPSDHQPKKGDAVERFSFEHDGETYTFKPTHSVVTPGFLRKNRRRDEIDAFFTMVEELVDDYDELEDKSPTLDVIDHMDRAEFNQLMRDFYTHLGGLSGE